MESTKNHWKTLKEINTRRMYLFFYSNSQEQKPVPHTLAEILNYSLQDDHEWAHALCDDLDKLLDLQLMQSMFFYPNRDDAKNPYREHAIVKRIR